MQYTDLYDTYLYDTAEQGCLRLASLDFLDKFQAKGCTLCSRIPASFSLGDAFPNVAGALASAAEQR
jgi:hypothetical protein